MCTTFDSCELAPEKSHIQRAMAISTENVPRMALLMFTCKFVLVYARAVF